MILTMKIARSCITFTFRGMWFDDRLPKVLHHDSKGSSKSAFNRVWIKSEGIWLSWSELPKLLPSTLRKFLLRFDASFMVWLLFDGTLGKYSIYIFLSRHRPLILHKASDFGVLFANKIIPLPTRSSTFVRGRGFVRPLVDTSLCDRMFM